MGMVLCSSKSLKVKVNQYIQWWTHAEHITFIESTLDYINVHIVQNIYITYHISQLWIMSTHYWISLIWYVMAKIYSTQFVYIVTVDIISHWNKNALIFWSLTLYLSRRSDSSRVYWPIHSCFYSHGTVLLVDTSKQKFRSIGQLVYKMPKRTNSQLLLKITASIFYSLQT
jgi:hypothetical protein